jgi:5-methylcytosine-specific restriction endonuclease McrBC GTP-binding regulatory subunit McrB
MQCLWFTTLVSKEKISSLYKTLNKVSAVEIKTIDMAQGQNKPNCSLDFLSAAQQKLGNSNKKTFSPEYFIPPIIFDSLENQFVTIHFPIIHLKGSPLKLLF